MNKALLVFDQVSFATLTQHVAGIGGAPARVRLDYVPRTTPVGHATISTGMTPSQHRVQGRDWCDRSGRPYKITEVVGRARPPRRSWARRIVENSLAAQLRAAQVRGVVIAAAKDFIPFLFGAWDSDVSFHPAAVSPELLTSGPLVGRFGFNVIVDVWTNAGAAALTAVYTPLAQRLTDLAATVPQSDVAMFPQSNATDRRVLQWAMPTLWGSELPRVKGEWADSLPQIAGAIDDFYTDACLLVSQHLPEPRALLQSCFASDAAGHRDGPTSQEYSAAVSASVLRAQRVHAAGWSVAVVSDHGGRETPRTWLHRKVTIPGTIFDGATDHFLPASTTEVLSGDHVVGYGASVGAMYRGLDPNGMRVLTVDPQVATRSFHPQQIPAWLALPPADVNISKNGRTVRGNHGACHDGTGISDLDNEVGAWTMPSLPNHNPPTRLEEVAAWFLSLP